MILVKTTDKTTYNEERYMKEMKLNSFNPDNILYPFAQLIKKSQPTYNPISEVVITKTPEIINGQWIQDWEIRAKPEYTLESAKINIVNTARETFIQWCHFNTDNDAIKSLFENIPLEQEIIDKRNYQYSRFQDYKNSVYTCADADELLALGNFIIEEQYE